MDWVEIHELHRFRVPVSAACRTAALSEHRYVADEAEADKIVEVARRRLPRDVVKVTIQEHGRDRERLLGALVATMAATGIIRPAESEGTGAAICWKTGCQWRAAGHDADKALSRRLCGDSGCWLRETQRPETEVILWYDGRNRFKEQPWTEAGPQLPSSGGEIS